MFREYRGNTTAFPVDGSLAGEAADRPDAKSKKPLIRTLEPRMVFDAAAAATVHQGAAPQHHEPTGDGAQSPAAHVAEAPKAIPVAPVENPAIDDGGKPAEPLPAHATVTDGIADAAANQAGRKEVFFVWDNVRDWQQITEELNGAATVHVLDSSKDGVKQVAAILKGESDIDAVHLISHGEKGNLSLGTAVLDAYSMQGRYHSDLAAIGQALAKDGDILVYGCDFAAGTDGRQATVFLGAVTHADIAASTDPTGAAARGGDWDLEEHAGTIEARIFTDDDYRFLLAPPTIDLDGTLGSVGDTTVNYTENGGSVAIVSTGALGATVIDGDGDLQTITITADAAPDGDAEHLTFNGTSIGLGSDSTNTITVNATTYQIDYTAATRTFVISNDAGGNIPSGGDTNALIRSITYDNTSDDPTGAGANTDRVFSFVATDATSAVSAVRTATVNIAAENDAPVNTLPGAGWSTNEDVAVQLTGLEIADPDAGGGTITVTLSVPTGSIDAVSGSGVTVGGTATQRTLSGTLTDINAYLASASAPTYTPAADANGNIALTMTTTDNGNSGGAAETDVDTATITISAVNDAPVGNNDSDTADEDTAATGNVLTNDTDVDGDALLVTQFVVNGTTYTAGQTATLSGVGTLFIGTDGAYTFTPAANYDGPVPAATYTVSDGSLTSTATLAITITPVNDLPVDGDEANTVSEDTVLTVADGTAGDLLNNATDVEGGALTITAFSVAGQSGPFVIGSAYTIANIGSITINANGGYSFVPAANYVGAIPVVTYTVSDAAGGTNTSTLTLTIVPANDAPAGTDNTVTITEDTAYTFSAAVFGFTDPNDSPANVLQAVIITTLPAASEGVLLLNGVAVTAGQTIAFADLGNLTFQPTADVTGNGVGAFTFQVVDDGGTADGGEDTDQSPNTFSFNITNVNDPPVGIDDTGSTPEDTPLSVSAGSGLLSNDTDADGDTLTITQFSVGSVTASAGQTGTIPGVGTLTVNADGSYSFTPVANFTGPVPDITYTVTDGNGTTDTAILRIEVIAVNDLPVDGNEANTVTEDTTLTVANGAAGDLLNNASDLDGDPLTITGFTVAGEAGPFVVGSGYLIAGVGTITINANGSYSFVPTANYDGAIPLVTYTVSDGAGGSDTSTLTLTLTPVNDAPVAQDDAATTPENTPVSGNVLGNDADVDDPVLTVTFFEFGGTIYGAGTSATVAGVGTLAINADGSYTFTPAQSYDGPVPAATYTVSDGASTDTAVLQITITPLNDPPVADDEMGTTPEDTALNVPAASGLLAGDTDVEGDPLTITEFEIGGTTYQAGDTAAINGVGSLTVNADGSYVFVPAADYNGPVPVATYTVSDGNGGTDQGTLTLTVTPVNDAPVAANDNGTTPEDTTLNGDILANDTDAEDDPLTIIGFQVAGVSGTFAAGATASIAGIGTITIDADGSYVLVPAANYNGPVPQITYIVSDGNGGTDTATLSLVVTPVNDPPIANDDSVDTPENTTLNGDVLANDTDADGDTLVVTDFEVDGQTYQPGDPAVIPGVGTITINADGTYTFDPVPGYSGPVPEVNYTISDGTATDDGTLDIEVVPPGGVGANDDTATTPEDVPLSGNVVNDDISPNGAPISVTEFTVAGDAAVYPAGSTATIAGIGTLRIDADGGYTFVPAPNYNGPVPVATYTATNGTATDTATLTITVTPVNDAPVAVDDAATTDEDTAVNGNVLTNDTDVETDALIVTQFSIGGINFNAGQTATIPSVGQLTIEVDGRYTFVPLADYNGTVPLVTYTVSDGNGGTDTGTLSIEVNPVNDAPAAVNDTATTPEDTTLSVSVPGLLANDTDVEGTPLTITRFSVAGVTGTFTAGSTAVIANVGQLTINANGSYTFVPDATFNGSVPLATYTVSDGVLSDTATLAITVTPVNDVPAATDDVGMVAEDTVLTVPAASGLLSNDTDIEGGPLAVTQFEINGIVFGAGTTAFSAGIGSLRINADGSYTFNPVANYNGPVPIVTYTVSDGNGGTATAELNIDITPVNDAPVAVDDTGTVVEDTTLTGNVLPNDTDIDGDTLSVAQFTVANDATVYLAGETATIAGIGSLTINGNGSYTFVPAPDYTGPVPVITYTASDGNGGIDTGTLTIDITPVNDAPLAVDDTATTPEDTTLIVPASGVLFNDVDVDGDTLIVDRFSVQGIPGSFLAGATTTIPGIGTLTVNANGSYTFVPVANYNGPGPVVTNRISDGTLTSTAVLTITITPVNDAPVDGNETSSVTEDTVLTVPAASGLLTNTTDIDGGTPSVIGFTVAGASGPFTIGSGYLIAGVGTVTINADGSYSFTPAANYTGAIPVITYTVSDGAGGTDTSTLTLTMVPVNDAPVDGNEARSVTEDTVLAVPAAAGLLANTTDVEGGTPSVASFTVAGQTGPFTIGSGYLIAGVGTITIDADGSYSFAPAANYTGAIPVITYTVSDGAGGTDTSTLTLTMVPVNDAPVDGNEAQSVTEDTLLAVPVATGLLANATDIDGGLLSVTQFTIAGDAVIHTAGDTVTITGIGTLTIRADGSYSFTPAANYTGAIPVITYTVSDGAGGTDTSTLTLTMVPVNDAPVDGNEARSVTEDTALTVPAASGLLANTTDIDGGTPSVVGFTVAGASGPFTIGTGYLIAGVGTVTINADGSYSFAPAANYTGAIPVITYTVSDGAGGTDTSTLTLTMVPVNDAPVDGNEARSVTEDTVLTVPAASGLLANTTDIDGGVPSIVSFTIAGQTGPFTIGSSYLIVGVGTLTIRVDGSYSFVPATNYTGTIPVITYTVSDGAGGTDTSTLTLTMVPVNDAPVDGNEARSVTEDTVLTVSATSGLLANTTDVDGGAPSVASFTVAGQTGPFTIGSGYLIAGVGTVTINADGSYSFAPVANYAGAIPVVSYTVSDGAGGTDTSTLTLTMVPVNDAPIAADDTGTTPEDTTLTGNVLPNDADIDGGLLRVTQFVFDGVTYSSGQTATIIGIGSLTINIGGGYSFVPAANYNGPVPVATYTVSDGAGGADTATLTITVTPVNDAPQPDDGDGIDGGDGDGSDISDRLSIDATTVIPVDVSGYFFDVDGDVLTYTISGLPAGLLIDPNTGVITGTLPNDASQGSPYTVVATATDPFGLSTTQTFRWIVVNPAPAAGDDTASGAEETIVTGTVLSNDSDRDGDAISISQFTVDGTTYMPGQMATLEGIGTLSINADGTYTFTPVSNYNGAVPIATYTLSDGNGGTDTATLAIVITPVNDAPDIRDDRASGNEDTTITGNVLENDSDLDGDTLTVIDFRVDGSSTVYGPGDTAAIPGVGSISLEANGDFAFIPAPNYDGPVPDISYTASDGNGGSGEAVLVITIVPVDDFVPIPDDVEPDLPSGPDIAYNPENVDGAVVEAVQRLNGLDDIFEFTDTPSDSSGKFALRTFLGGSSTIVLDRPGVADDRVHVESIRHAGIIYLQIVEEAGNDGETAALTYRLRGADDAPALVWLRQVGPMTFAGRPDAGTNTVDLILSITERDGRVSEHEIRLDSFTGHLSQPSDPEDHGFDGRSAPMFSEQMNGLPRHENMARLEWALGFR